MNKRLNFHVRREPWQIPGLELFITADLDNGKRACAQEVVFKETQEDGVWPQPALRVAPEDAQQLMDELWRAGLRPTEGTGSAGAMAAQTRHLEDMRALVFKGKKA